jgi:hypothetical protein
MRLRAAPALLLLISCGSVSQPVLSTPKDAMPDVYGTPDAAVSDTPAAVCPDLDGDGHTQIACGGDDCDDNNRLVHPGLAEVCDGIDNDCNQMTDEAPAGLECSPGQICAGGHCGCPPSRSGGCADGGESPFTDGGSNDDAACTNATGQYGPFPACQPELHGACDPVCQSGCGCNERCRIDGGVVVCRKEGPNFLEMYDSCVPANDQCRPGSICLQEAVDHPACGAHCYRHCRGDSDCSPGSKCTIDIQFGTTGTDSKVCAPPPDPCNPFGPARCARTDRPYPTFGCYLMSSSHPDIPICDCAGTIKTGDPCTFEHECEPGAECVLLGAARLCRRVCKVGVMGLPVAGACPLGLNCTAFPGGSAFGYCH